MDDLLSQARAVLTTTPPRWLGLTETLSEALLTRPPAPGEWSALECLRHLLDTERLVFPNRVQAFLAGQDIPAFDPATEGSQGDRQSPAALAAEFARRRAESLTLLTQVTTADLARTARHSELGVVTLGELLHEWAAHDLMHTVQAERALLQPFIAGCGPWRPNFQDHDLGA